MRFLPALVLASLVACSSSVELPPVSPANVQVFMPWVEPEESYRDLDQFIVDWPGARREEEAIKKLHSQAAEAGADALLVDMIGYGDATPCAVRKRMGLYQDDWGSCGDTERTFVQARAIYFPSLHPELAEKK